MKNVKYQFVFSMLLLLPVIHGSAFADRPGQFEWSGYLGMESRYFWQEPLDKRQDTSTDVSLVFQPELRWYSDSSDQRVSIIGFARSGAQDEERNHVDIREAYWAIEHDELELLVGVNKVFWGVAESNHLVDIINQTDGVEDIDGEDKLGQPMVNINWQSDWGTVSAFLLPYFRERTFPGVEGRLRASMPITDDAEYESSDENNRLDGALRYSHYFGDVDVGMYLFEGTAREPSFILSNDGQQLIPYYELIRQAGLDLQYTVEAWLWKLELIGRNINDDEFTAMVGGYEYTFYQIFDSAIDLGVLMEGHYDDREDSSPVLLDNDLFVGGRLALNDAQDTSLLAGLTIDVETDEIFYNIEAERRFGDSVSAELRIRGFANSAPGEALYSLERDDYAQLTVKAYF